LWCQLSRRDWLGIVPQVVAVRRLHTGQITEVDAPEQTRLGLEVAQEHIESLTGQTWSLDELRALRDAIHGRDVGLGTSLRVLRRWREAWRRDPSLTSAERSTLGRWTLHVATTQLQRWGTELPVAGRVVGASIEAGSAVNRLRVAVRDGLRKRGSAS
jgi:hypothetical protein